MAVFDWAESPGTSVEEVPRVRTARFGDGYAQHAPDGLNSVPQVWSLRFSRCENSKADQIMAFFRQHKGAVPFDWTPLWATAPIRVRCTRWNRSQNEEYELSDITATFEQDFAP